MTTCIPTVEKINSIAEFAMLREEWGELLEASDNQNIFLTWEWMFSWWQHLSQGRRLHLLVVRRSRKMLAIAPLAIRPGQPRRLRPFRALEFLGTGMAGSDYLDIIVRRDEEHAAIAALTEYFVDRDLVLELSQVNATISHARKLSVKLVERGWVHTPSTIEVCPYISLGGHDWESYLASIGPAHRYNIRRRSRKLRKLFTVAFEKATSDVQRQHHLGLLVTLHNKRWAERGGSNAMSSPEVVAFHDTWSQFALERGWLRLNVLWLNGRPAAALYGFMYRNRFYFYQSGFDPVFRKYSVGLVTMALTIKSALSEGVVEYDLLHGDEEYKFLWARDTRKLICHNIYPPGMHGRFYQQAMGFRQGIKNVIRSRSARRLVV